MTVDLAHRTAVREEHALGLSDLEFDILAYLIEHRGRTVNPQQLLRNVRSISGDITTRTINRHVASLRKEAEPDREESEYVETIYGVGHKFAA